MENATLTAVSGFIILGFVVNTKLEILLFILFLVIYIVTVSSNVVIMVVTSTSRQLQTPMYFFLAHFSFMEIFYTSTISPPMLTRIIMGEKYVSFACCMAQLYLFMSGACVENCLLAAMAYDRYVAICNPLRYSEIISVNVCRFLAGGSWILGFLIPIVPVVLASFLLFCGPNQIDHFFCDLSPIVRLSCSDTLFTQRINSVFASAILLGTFSVTLYSYVCIASTIIKIPSTTGKRKAISTCSSHLLVVTIFYGTGIFSYIIPTAQHASFNVNKMVTLVYTVMTPMVNPFIYTLRNIDVTNALKQIVNSCINPHLGKRMDQINSSS